MSPVPALPLILIHKLSVGSSSIPRQTSMHSSWSFTQRATPPPYLPCQSLLKSLYPSIPILQSYEPSHQVSTMPMRSQPCRCAHVSNSSCIFPMLLALPQRHLSRALSEADLLTGVPLCCPSGALLLTCDPPPGFGHLLLGPASNW